MAASWDTSRYLSLFVGEATEHLDALGKELVRLEGGVTAEAIDSLFRHAHSVKGMAGSMGYEATALLGHRLEDLLDRVRAAPYRFDRTTADLVLHGVDALTAHVKAASAGQPFPDSSAIARQLELAALSLQPGTTPVPFREALPGPPLVESAPAPENALPPRYDVKLRVTSSAQPGVRGFLAYKRLSSLGNIFRCTPALDEVKAGKLPGGVFAIELETTEPEASIGKTVSQVADVELVGISKVVAPPPVPVAEEAAAEPEAPRVVGQESPRTVRVRTELLDGFLDLAGELLLATAGVREVGRVLADEPRAQLTESVDRLHTLVRGLHDLVMEARMTPVSSITDRLPRAARDIARRRGREIELIVSGSDVELDRAIVEELNDPVLHLLRNAIDHGVEPPEERRMRGKQPRGTVKLTVRRVTDRVLLELEDDGRGMDTERLKAVAIERGVITAEAARVMTEREALMLCTAPGLSTAPAVTDISGRGVGMDAVKRAVEAVGGTLEIQSRRGAGTTFRLSLPLTISMVNLLLVGIGNETYGLPITKVAGVVEVSRASLTHSRDESVLPFGTGVVPARELSAVLEVPGRPCDVNEPSPFVVVESDEGRVALAVDSLLGQEEVVLKALTRPLDQVPGLAGVTVLGNGRPVFILDVAKLEAPRRAVAGGEA
ncbi:MAG: chemotaxis protein CheA [Archangium gephyra]|uniref:Chemotaxis protein CheA n=1 Tax=Archangium gephyra TaxID=48 RepID=A0A2W5TF25_9BACT|nr:MAG: chemotaxis protein CheA [Archangium gephyra]